jgi:hypothetical protein
MKIKAIEGLKFATDGVGHKVGTIAEGCEGECPDHIAEQFIDAKLAEKVVAEKKAPAPENKKVPAAPENKKVSKKKASKKKETD